MSETKPSQAAVKPEEKKTVQMSAAPEWAIYINDQVRQGFERMDKRADSQDERLDKMDRQLTLVVEDGKDHNKRITALEIYREQDSKRAEAHSLRVREPSQHDIETKDALKAEKEARERLEKKFDDYASRPDTTDRLIAEVKEAAKTPLGQKLVGAAGGVLLLALTLLGFKMQAQVNHLETKPETVQPAPTVYVPVPTPMAVIADGGAK